MATSVTSTPFALPERLPPPQALLSQDRPIDTSKIFPEGPFRNLYHKIQPLIEGYF